MLTDRYIIEIGMGVDIHGQDVTKAAVKAAKDAISRSCLIGLNEILNFSLEDMNEKILIDVTVAVSRPEEVKKEEIKKCFPVGKVEVEAVFGGLKTEGLYFTKFGDKDSSIEVAVASVSVKIIK